MTSHAQARQDVIAGFRLVFGRDPSRREAQWAQAVFLGESHYGDACYRNLETGEKICNTFNMGALQCGARPPCPSGCFEATDHRGPEQGGTPYQACFRLFPDAASGYAESIKAVYVNRKRENVRLLALTGDIAATSAALRASGYFELSLNVYIRGKRRDLEVIAKALKEPPFEPRSSSRPSSSATLWTGAAFATAVLVGISRLR